MHWLRSASAAISARGIWLVAAITVLGAALRIYRLSAWGFEGDEIHTLRHTLAGSGLTSAKPLLFWLNHVLILPWHAPDELGLRLLPALFGVACIPMIYFVTARLLGQRVGVIAALLVAVHPWHVYWSQFGRYYSLVFLGATLYPLALYGAVKGWGRRWMIAGVVGLAAATLAHPSAVVLVGGLVVGLWLTSRVGGGADPRVARATNRAMWVGVIAGAILAAYFAPVLLNWQQQNDEWGHRGPTLLLSFADGLTLSVAICAAGGLTWLWLAGERQTAVLLAALLGVPFIFLTALTYLMPVSNAYLWATGPVVFIAAAAFFDRLWISVASTRGRWLAVATPLALVLIAGAPRLWSHYRDGTRPDLRAGALYLAAHAQPDDAVLADQPRVIRHYLAGRTVGALRRQPAELERTLAQGAAWLVAHRRWRGGFSDLDLGPATSWVASHCVLAASFGRPRLDYKQDEVQVYRCDGPRVASE